jgi:hypothetical protein
MNSSVQIRFLLLVAVVAGFLALVGPAFGSNENVNGAQAVSARPPGPLQPIRVIASTSRIRLDLENLSRGHLRRARADLVAKSGE